MGNSEKGEISLKISKKIPALYNQVRGFFTLFLRLNAVINGGLGRVRLHHQNRQKTHRLHHIRHLWH